MAQLICATPALASTDLRFVQAYQALQFQIPAADRAALRNEARTFNAAVRARCGIPLVGTVNWQPNDPSAVACVQREYAAQQNDWLARLDGPARQEARRDIQQHVQLQAALQAAGYLSAAANIDGVYGPTTRTAIQAWQNATGHAATGFLADADALALLGAPKPAPSPPNPPLSATTPRILPTLPAPQRFVPVHPSAVPPSSTPRPIVPVAPPVSSPAPPGSAPSYLVPAAIGAFLVLLFLAARRKNTKAPIPKRPASSPAAPRPPPPSRPAIPPKPVVRRVVELSGNSRIWACPGCHTNNPASTPVCEVCAEARPRAV